jgi:SAM-dependent methyltransferase
MTSTASDHLLRTLAAVAPSSRVLDVDCEDAERLSSLFRLGFEAYATHPDEAHVASLRGEVVTSDDPRKHIFVAGSAALGFPDDYFDWIVADRSGRGDDSLETTLDVLAELRRVLKPGGWIFLVLPVGTDSQATDDECLLGFYRLVAEARLELAEKGTVYASGDGRLARAIFRRVEADTPR